MSKRKKQLGLTQEQRLAAARMGTPLSPEKKRVLLGVTLVACALPMVMGVRLWEQIPELVPGGFVGANRADDSTPRWVVAIGLPGIMCLLNFLAHFMVDWNQRKQRMVPRASRVAGRWGFPVISVLLCSGLMLESSGGELSLPFITPCVVGLVLMILGGHMWDCPRDAKVALRMRYTEQSEVAWKNVHRFAGWVWMMAGAVVILGAMLTSTSNALTAVVVLLALVAPFAYAWLHAGRLTN